MRVVPESNWPAQFCRLVTKPLIQLPKLTLMGVRTDSNPHLHRFTAWAIQPIILLTPCKKFM